MPSSPSALERRPTKITKMDDSMDVADAITRTAPVPSYRPDAKARRYDRQLRLWASAGQRSLEQARVLLVGCDAAGSQSLKNLVLPGISQFTILSSKTTTAQDVATNFFLHPDSIGSNIAQESAKYLKELNPAVEGEARKEDPAIIIKTDPQFFLSFTLIILSNVEPSLENQISEILWEASSSIGGPDIPLIVIRNSGFISRVQIQLREHTGPHPDTTHTLRIDEPFLALEQHARSLDLANMDSMEHSHIPWVVLLVRAASLWKESHGGKLPETSEEKAEFKEKLKAEKIKGDEENYDEALAQAYRVWSKSDPSYHQPCTQSKNLHILLHTLNQYIIPAPHLPPTSPSLPDMHSSTTSYVALQNMYKTQYRTDLKQFKYLLNEVLQNVGLPADTVPDEEVEGFVKNVGGVGIIKGTSLSDSKNIRGLLLTELENFDEENDSATCLSMYLALLASETFFESEKRWPGASFSDNLAADNQKIQHILLDLFPNFSEGLPEILEQSVEEVIRGGFATIPTTAAFVGGIVAQEAIKLVTNQYTPLDNTVVLNLIKSESSKFKF
ncbi:amyloid beta protein binding protein 1 [Cryptococcus deuterogattii 99/473]|uniref:NEDD8-activating enzyme E1 regulatory subunit n=1 Tax=Cryptococcus deuterogattii Ram5 TaxID=1296110 RepID=A0A0D0UUA1_9TREE|nr:amyloid beta protein binding protein 1 [Cryptococcus deuterogattii Ram5]KIR70990.1 amyloid beta protein binding protein 1 [Cryptococcus deuterogattii CA1014]KIR97336.1 amyloid beta protein binding protein 1 [Cryptococcus deuterogattii 2001/935-1]KIY57818.1 amyloid beta protein binding protein 1 [Cryptococcus deuterogattii 99/473]